MTSTQTHQTHADPTGEPECGCEPDAGGRGATGLSRRRLLGLAAAGGLVTATTSTQARVALAATGDPGTGASAADVDVLVVVSLRGGFDGLSAIVPVGDPHYAPARPSIAVPARLLHRVDATFGLHPSMKPLIPLWQAGRLGAVHAVGQPAATRSHFDAMEEMERAAPGSALRTGWIDRTIGLLPAVQTFTATQLNTPTLPASLRGPNRKFATRSLADVSLMLDEKIMSLSGWQKAVAALHSGARSEVSEPVLSGLSAVAAKRALSAPDGDPAVPYPATTLGEALRDVARLIRNGVGLRFASVDIDDWDMHQGLGAAQKGWFRDKLAELSLALAAFAADLGPELDRVTVVTLSEFGRRIEENGSGGVDHGHGNAVLVLGGGVRGGRVHGRWPGLAPAARHDGDLAVTTDYRQLMAEILTLRCGIPSVEAVFPGLRPSSLGVVAARA